MKSARYLGVCFAALFLAGTARADLEKGMAAVERQDWAAALAQFQPLAEQGDPSAQVNLGNLYFKGLGVEQDYSAALRWYLKAARQGSAMAQDKLGTIHFYGLGVREDHAAALTWFRSAAEQGDAGAAVILGNLYEEGDGTPKDLAQAYFWYALAAEQGRNEALDSKNALAERMSPGEMNAALDLLADWSKQHPPVDVEAALAKLHGPAAAPSGAKPAGKRSAASAKPAAAADAKPAAKAKAPATKPGASKAKPAEKPASPPGKAKQPDKAAKKKQG
jgi:TPR repeat protein